LPSRVSLDDIAGVTSEASSIGLSNETMHALRLHERGGPQKLVLEEARVRPIGIGDALVRVHGASITPTELEWPSTWVDRAGNDRRPVIPGHEVSGVVSALGYGTTGLTVGEAVFGMTDWYRDGAAAEYIAVEGRNLVPKPALLSHTDAAAVPLPGLTAYQALFDHGRLSRGHSALIHGAGGGVGTLAVQLAHAAGARVVATGRAWAEPVVTALGANEFVDLDHSRFEDVTGPFDLVLDLVGGDIPNRSWAVVKPGGVLVSVVGEPGAEAPQARRARSVFFVVEPNREELLELAGRIDSGELRPIVGEVVPLEQGRRGFEAKGRHGVPGKVVLKVAG
jgi:NADPH:quinone reductase-like Zn-dependent oxidoreductase